MTTVDSKTVVSLDATDFVFSAKKDNDNDQVNALSGTLEGSKTPSNDSDPLVYFRKGDGRRPVTGGLKASQSAKQNSSSSSSKNNPPPKLAYQRPIATNPPKASHGSSKDKAKK